MRSSEETGGDFSSQPAPMQNDLLPGSLRSQASTCIPGSGRNSIISTDNKTLFKPLQFHVLLPGSSNWVCLVTLSMTERTGLTPDPVDPEGLRHAVTQQGTLLDHQSNALQQLASAQQDMFRAAAASASATSHENIRLQPEVFHGDVEACGGFLLQCQLIFQQPSSFPSERSKVAYVVSLLTGRAAQWGRNSHICSSYQLFSAELREVFDPIKPHQEAAYQLTRLRQGNESVDDFAMWFRTLAGKSKWNDHALYDMFHQGHSDRIKDELAARELPPAINDLISVASRIDRRIRESDRERSQRLHSRNPRPAPHRAEDEPMQLGRTRLSQEERDRRFRQNLCFFCASPDHSIGSCPVKDSAQHGRRRRVCEPIEVFILPVQPQTQGDVLHP
uniref:Retrotransposon gag domain-containing protein n=1 Tax=Oryzias melastigma TaxID=30732 RepID=A0A3B3DC44_ORYME